MIVFKNDGVIDIRAIKTFGVNSKDDKESAIGYFGTGLKYAIAILLRNNHQITFICGGKRYEMSTIRSKVRNDEFDIVTMNGEELGFTTDLGKNWEMWMAFREIYSNMLDEQGAECFEASVFSPDDDTCTYVLVSGATDGFEKCWRERNNYFLNKNIFRTIAQHAEVDCYEPMHTSEQGLVFYKGVRVMQTRLPARYDYNHHCGLTLTEDRTISDAWSTLWHLSALVIASRDKKFIKTMVMAPECTYEASINFSMNTAGGQNIDVFLDVVGELRVKYKDDGVNPSAIKLHKEQRKVTTVMPGISCYLNEIETVQLEKAVAFCKDTLELELDDYRLIVAKDLGDDHQLGRADMDAGIMYISKQAFRQGTKAVATTILEEYTHCKHRVRDETVEQKWVYLNQILSLGERIQGEPL